jgi:hypothetical protein
VTPDERATLRKLRDLMARVDPDGWFIERGLPNRTVLQALDAAITTPGPIALNAAQERAVKVWAADDRLWTTQETVEFNLRTFARLVLAGNDAASSEVTSA